MITAQQLLIDQLDDILELERTALVNGQLDQLETLLEEKDALISELNEMDSFKQDELTSIHTKVTHNQALLESAMEGIRAVAARMQELRNVRKGLDVYDRMGQKTSHPNGHSQKLEKRA
ncbi:flagellar biosynthesis protein FlgN [Epibacterium ulvae]|uniref:flagellar biosynthesis protein FlgN n=1 Tax=Epibacterium ulvae TaxID=1156985 RepID=UPI00248FD249|nr:flagellar biosynthesis protein FlgN [Epibacterium ulvae]